MREHLEVAIRDFNKTLGIDDMPLPDNAPLLYSFERGGDFSIECLEENVLFYLVREVSDYALDDVADKAMGLCHYHQSRKFDTQCALRDVNKLMFLVSLAAEGLNAPRIEEVLQHLMKTHDAVASK